MKEKKQALEKKEAIETEIGERPKLTFNKVPLESEFDEKKNELIYFSMDKDDDTKRVITNLRALVVDMISKIHINKVKEFTLGDKKIVAIGLYQQ